MFTNNQTSESTKMVETPPLRKYMFDRSFDGAASANATERPRGPVTLKPEQLDAVKKESYDIGFTAGKKAALEENEQFLRLTLSQLDVKLGDIISNFQKQQTEHDRQLRIATLAIVRKLFPSIAERQGLQEIQSMLEEVIAEMVHEPRFVIRINEGDFDAINTKVHEITVQKAYAGKVVVLADVEIARGDCRVEWADGGVERKAQATWQAIEQTVAPDGASNEPLPQEITNG